MKIHDVIEDMIDLVEDFEVVRPVPSPAFHILVASWRAFGRDKLISTAIAMIHTEFRGRLVLSNLHFCTLKV
jgi:hypothetical protein